MQIKILPLLLVLCLVLSLSIGYGCSSRQNNKTNANNSPANDLTMTKPTYPAETPKDLELKALDKDLDKLQEEIKQMIGNARCNTALDCRSLALGHKACGGPTAYLPYSVLLTNSEKLAQKVSTYNNLVDKTNKLSGYFSTCNFLTPSPIDCVNHQCQEITLPCYNTDCNENSPAPTESSQEQLKQEITQLIGSATCSSSEQCGNWTLLYLASGCKQSETFAFSTLDTTNEPLLAQTLMQYGIKIANQMHTASKHFTSYLDYSMGSCQNNHCSVPTPQALSCKP